MFVKTEKPTRDVFAFYVSLKKYCLEKDIGDICFAEGEYPYLVDGEEILYELDIDGKKISIEKAFRAKFGDAPLDGRDMYLVFTELAKLSVLKNLEEKFDENLGVDFSAKHEGTKIRVNVGNMYGGFIEIVSRIIKSGEPPTLEKLGLLTETDTLYKKITQNGSGLILVVGPTGSGKSTTLVAMLNEINTNQQRRIITFEDPIEFEHKSKKSKVIQKEVGVDVQSYAHGLHLVLRQKPHVVAVGEIRDAEVMKAAIELTQTGHLALSTFHSKTVTQAMSRILEYYKESERDGIRSDLSEVLLGIFVQRLLPKKGGGKILLREILINTPLMSRAIAKGDFQAVESIMKSSSSDGMITSDLALKKLRDADLIDDNTLFKYAVDKKWAEMESGQSY